MSDFDWAVLAFVIGVPLHELFHVVAAVALGLKIKGIVVNRKGVGIAREAGTKIQDASVAVAGPLANLLLAVCFWPSKFAVFQLILCVVNLLPVSDSDGSRILQVWSRSQE